jgi:diamine N-acetyltransferase
MRTPRPGLPTGNRQRSFRMITLRPITTANRDELEAMRVSPLQENFVTTVADSLEEAAEEPDGRAIAWGVYADETPVGFVMISDDVGGPGYISQYLWKLFIDEGHQGRGFGTSTLDLIVEFFRSRPGVSVMWTSAGEGEGSPIPFYERYGFVRTGELVFEQREALLRLDLTSRPMNVRAGSGRWHSRGEAFPGTRRRR